MADTNQCRIIECVCHSARTREAQGTTLFTALLALVGIGVVVQLWLLAASVDAFMRHEGSTAVHAALASVVVFVINGLLVLYVFNFDRKIKQDRG